MFAPRPKPEETDEDLLRLQEEFFRNKAENKVQTCVKIISSKAPSANDQSGSAATGAQNTDPQCSGTSKNKNGTSETEAEKMTVDPQELISNTFEEVPKNPNLGSVKEKSPNQPISSVFVSRSLQGFPKAKKRDTSIKPKGGSIFASQMKKQRLESQPSPGGFSIGNLVIKERTSTQGSASNISGTDTVSNKNIPTQSYILTGSDKEELHEENIQKLQEMSESEILEEQENLLETMDPALIAFLRSRRNKLPEASSNKISSVAEQIRAGEEVKLEELETPMEILTQPDSDKWLNFDSIEQSKLAWMKSVDIPKPEKGKPYEARFDFDGNILPYAEEEISEKNRVLYHHGEEPGRPGYTLQELFQLCRSSVLQQKIVALNTIANILSFESLGLYEGIIELPIEQIFFVLRFCLDDNSPSVLNAAVKALRNLFVFSVDETCLDALLGFGFGLTQPNLSVEPEEKEDDSTVNDQQLAEKNLVKCLLRSDILVRIRYIINVIQPPVETIVYALEILTRLARDSYFICMQLYRFPDLISSIVHKYIKKDYRPRQKWDDNPLPEAFRFLRILCTKSTGFARDLVVKFGLMESIAACLSNINVSTNPNGLKLSVQVLHLWSVLTIYGLGTDYFGILQPILIQLLNHHVYNTDLAPGTSYLMHSHVAAILNLISEGFAKQLEFVFPTEIIQNGFIKWSSQFSMLEQYTCGKLQIMASASNCLVNLLKYDYKGKLNTEKIEFCLAKMIKSLAFTKVTDQIKSGSNVLSNKKTKKSSPNLLGVEAALWDAAEHVIPILQRNSSIPLIATLSRLIHILPNSEIKLSFLRHSNLGKYFKALKQCSKFSLVNNWFTQVESKLIMNILRIAVDIPNDIDMTFFYESTVQCITLFTAEQKSDMEFILKNIIFNIRFFPSDILIQNLTIGTEINFLKATLSCLDEVVEVYSRVLGINANFLKSPSDLCIGIPLKTIAPIDWIYSPILVMYSAQQDNKCILPEEVHVHRIKICLRWIYLYEYHFTALASLINATERYCRLACVFLGKDDLFLDVEINELLELCLKCVLKNGLDQLNFDKAIEGLNNFQDFYVQLLEQYQGVSYGDMLFGNFILVPLLQRHNVKWRKILWSEYAGVLQIFNVTKQQLLFDFKDFIQEPESDVSLLKCYKRALDNNLVRKNSVLYEIARYHVDRYVENFVNSK